MLQWKVAYAENRVCKTQNPVTVEEIRKTGWPVLPASVPGCIEQDLMAAGKLPDLYYSDNTLMAQKLENLHLWYFTEFRAETPKTVLRLEGVDTLADIYVNGVLAATAENMFLPVEVPVRQGENQVVVHIKPVCIEARRYPVPIACNCMKYNAASLYIRKAAHMYGWDIMPRIIAAGLWKPAFLTEKKPDRIEDVYFAVQNICPETGEARLRFCIDAALSEDFTTDYTVAVRGECDGSVFSFEEPLWHTSQQTAFTVTDCRLWWPRNAGPQNLYDTTVSLYYQGELRDTYQLQVGIRTVELDTSPRPDSTVDEFCFRVNGKRIFALGTNWVPLDAFHANDPERLGRALELLEDIGCNMVRCWGGNVYESDAFFDFCDRHGILVWQDFAMGCATYPRDEDFARRLEKEAVYEIKRLRNHPSLALWAGDNECDLACMNWAGIRRDPNQNTLTRQTLRRAVEDHDYARPYLPSSPYVSPEIFALNRPLPENHLWGPRDYFKGDFYRNSVCRFASETGYHGFPSPKSLEKFLRQPEKIWEAPDRPTDEYLVHAACMEPSMDSPFAYRIKLAYNQVVTLFGKAEDNLNDFAKQSQISQAEAKKYFIERFRLRKWERTGIIWWNLLDGWPQVSDAVVDYYYTKKLAYSYIKRSQAPVCLIFDEPENGMLSLWGCNDTPESAEISYAVRKIPEETPVMQGKAVLAGDRAVNLGVLRCEPDTKNFYQIEWSANGEPGRNHYVSNMPGLDYRWYLEMLNLCGMDAFEGF